MVKSSHDALYAASPPVSSQNEINLEKKDGTIDAAARRSQAHRMVSNEAVSEQEVRKPSCCATDMEKPAFMMRNILHLKQILIIACPSGVFVGAEGNTHTGVKQRAEKSSGYQFKKGCGNHKR